MGKKNNFIILGECIAYLAFSKKGNKLGRPVRTLCILKTLQQLKIQKNNLNRPLPRQNMKKATHTQVRNTLRIVDIQWDPC